MEKDKKDGSQSEGKEVSSASHVGAGMKSCGKMAAARTHATEMIVATVVESLLQTQESKKATPENVRCQCKLVHVGYMAFRKAPRKRMRLDNCRIT